MTTPRPVLLQLFDALHAAEAGDRDGALAAVDHLLATAPGSGAAVDRLARAFAAAMRARITGETTGVGNLYADSHDPRDMLKAFEVLAAATPFIRFGHAAANHGLVQAVGHAPSIHIVDIGVGSGVQWLHLLAAIPPDARARTSIRLTGIDVPAPGPDPMARIVQAGAAVADEARRLGIPFEFQAVAGFIEDLDLAPYVAGDGALVINAALALHHVPVTDGRRDAVLARLRAFNPVALCLVEPDVEHNALPFGPRITESIVHYLTVFDALESTLAEHGDARATLETAFFGREILNIVVGEGDHRVERHERHDAWHARLTAAGFAPLALAHVRDVTTRELAVTPPFAITLDGACLVLSWRDLPVLAVSIWT